MNDLYVCIFLSNSPVRLFICSFVRLFVCPSVLCAVNGAIVVAVVVVVVLLLYVVIFFSSDFGFGFDCVMCVKIIHKKT